MKGLRIATAVMFGLIVAVPRNAAAGIATDILGPVAAEVQARRDALTGDLGARQLKEKKALDASLAAVAATTDHIDSVARTALAVDRTLRKIYRAEFVPPGSGASPLPGLSRGLADALQAEVARVHWGIVSRFSGAITVALAEELVRGKFGKVRAALLASEEALAKDSVPQALRRLAVAAAGIEPWHNLADMPVSFTGLTVFLGRERLAVRRDAVPTGAPAAFDLALGRFDPVTFELIERGRLRFQVPSIPGPGLYPIAEGDATWEPVGSATVWTVLPGGWIRVIEGDPATSPFVGVFDMDFTDGKRVLKVRYGSFSL